MRAPFGALVASSTYEELVATMHSAEEHVAEEVADSDALVWDRDAELANLVTLMHQGASELILDGMTIEPREV